MLFHILNVSVRQKLVALTKFEILYILLKNEHNLEISNPHFEGLARAHAPNIFRLSMNVLKYFQLEFYVATTKNNKFYFSQPF